MREGVGEAGASASNSVIVEALWEAQLVDPVLYSAIIRSLFI